MKLLILTFLSLSLVGCATPDVAKKDQLILKVPPELLEKAQPLKQL
jgi:hypothetical protein